MSSSSDFPKPAIRSEIQSQSRNRESPAEHGATRGQQGSKRFVVSTWHDTNDRDLCAHALVLAPEHTPIAGRTGLATARWEVVDRRSERDLICNRLHEGDCAWPWDVPSL